MQDFAKRLRVTRGTVQRLENGDPKVELGLAFEACTILGIQLFDGITQLQRKISRGGKELAATPTHTRRQQIEVDDDPSASMCCGRVRLKQGGWSSRQDSAANKLATLSRIARARGGNRPDGSRRSGSRRLAPLS